MQANSDIDALTYYIRRILRSNGSGRGEALVVLDREGWDAFRYALDPKLLPTSSFQSIDSQKSFTYGGVRYTTFDQ